MEGLAILRVAAVLLAVAGGVIATYAYVLSRRPGRSGDTERKVKAVYLVSYIAMSLSVFALALHGLLS